MKKFLKSTAVLVLLFATTTAMASNPKISLIPVNYSKSLVFEMESHSNETKIELMNDNAQVIYSENIFDTNYTKKFNLENLMVGTYYFTVESALTAVVYILDVESNKIKIVNTKESTTKPIFRKEGDKVYVNLFNADLQKVDIEIVDSRGNIVFSESIKGELIIGKTFNFEKAVKENYTIRVKDSQEIYYKSIYIG